MKLNVNETNSNTDGRKKKAKTFKDLQEQVVIFEEKTGKEFSTFFRKYYPKLVYYITKICKDNDLAQDIAIESFVSSLEKIDNYQSKKAQYSTWLFTIARNSSLQALKEKKTISMDMEIDDSTTIKDFLSDKSEENEIEKYSTKISNEKARITKECIKKLKQPYRKVVEMRELKRMSYKDIASELGNDIDFELSVHNNNKIKLPKELSYTTEIIDMVSGKNIIDFKLIEGDSKKTPFYTHIELNTGVYRVVGRQPHNLSTLKSQIRNGRVLLRKMVKNDFKKITKVYGEY